MKRVFFATVLLIASTLACSISPSPPTTIPATPSNEPGPPHTLTPAEIATEIPPTATLPPVDVSSGLIAFYAFDGGSNDSSGNGLNGDMKSLAAAEDNSALIFNGVDSLITIPDNDLLDLTGDFSIAFSIKGNPASTHEWLILTKHQAGQCQPSQTSWMLRYTDLYGLFLVNYDNSVDCGKTIFSIPELNLKDGEWHHLAITFEKATSKMVVYADGQVITTTNADVLIIQNNSLPFVIGNQFKGVPQHTLDAALGELRIYNYPIPPEVVQALLP